MTIIYENNFGELHKDKIVLNLENKKKAINFENIIKIKFIKRQKLHLNYALFLIAILLFNNKNDPDFSNQEQFIILLISIFFLIISFYIKLFQYRLIILKNQDFEIIKVPKKQIKNALDLTNQLTCTCFLSTNKTTKLL